jgi:hypothetical protein
MLDALVLILPPGLRNSAFGENFLTFQLQQRGIAGKLENVVCEHGKP